MRILLDSQVFLWQILGEEHRVREPVRELLRDADTLLLLSVASIWELIIKASRGKLPLPRPAAEFLSGQITAIHASLLPVSSSHFLALERLPWIHRDPFDRILVAQAQAEDIALVSADPALRRYEVRVIW